jgi:hypothetical protein
METTISVASATYTRRSPDLVSLVFSDNTMTSIYLNDGSPRLYAHDLLDEWIAAGNTIADPPP